MTAYGKIFLPYPPSKVVNDAEIPYNVFPKAYFEIANTTAEFVFTHSR
jgi:hypothetical protein